ncbi:MAG: hypothetical protein NZ927_01075 [Candidatus Calescibacterium sp.]|nr:hypothetical protein [Candidatus Calescibacterium sp.]
MKSKKIDKEIKKVLITLFFLFSCKSGKNIETLEQKIIREGKEYSQPEINLVSSTKVRFILRDFPNIISDIFAISYDYFPENLTQSYSIQDIYSFFQIENIWVVPEYCSSFTCPKMECKLNDQKDNTMNREIQIIGECFNDVFDFSGRVIFKDSFVFSGKDFLLSYNLDFKDWYFRGVLTDERVFYSGSVSFVSQRNSGRNSINRKINIKGNSFIGENRKQEFPINFEHEFSYLEMQQGNTSTIFTYLTDYRNNFCFARVSGFNYIFSCERSYSVEKLIYAIDDKNISTTGQVFTIYGKDTRSWFEVSFSVKTPKDSCDFISGEIMITSGDEKLILEYEDKFYEKGKCNFLCPSRWTWRNRDGQTTRVECLP